MKERNLQTNTPTNKQANRQARKKEGWQTERKKEVFLSHLS
jgi:hypothetical protein